MTNQTIKNRINKELHALPVYFSEIPLDVIFYIVKEHAGQVVQEDGTPWSGILCGDDSAASFGIAGYKFALRVMWHKMPSGNFEITSYVS
jgi:hypothetical protein